MSQLSAKVTITVGDVPGLLAKVAMGTYNGVSDGAEIVETAAKENAPVATGALRDSIDTTVVRGIQNTQGGGPLNASLFGVTATVAPHTDYDVYVEFGTGKRGAASPGAGPGDWYSPDWPGMKAQPYLRPAADDNRDAVVDAITSGVAEALS
jgi:HK97 gp10 family phage protein